MKELKSYSEAVIKPTVESITLKKIKTAVKDIVEDRSKNLMIFGLAEATDKDIHSTVQARKYSCRLKRSPFSRQRGLGNSIIVSFPGLSKSYYFIKLFKQYTHNIAMTLYKINPLRIQKSPLTIKNYPWPCGSKLSHIGQFKCIGRSYKIVEGAQKSTRDDHH